MTSRIQPLDPTTASRIAAGEVIERPTSVIKELIDNALDAGSTRIDIELVNGGRRLIQVTDNGCGMHAEEATLAHPQVTFHMQHEGRRLLFAPASNDLRQRLAVVFGQEMAVQMLPVFWQSFDLVIQGAVSPPTLHRATRQRQYYWVNGRPVRSPLVSAALERAYGALLPPGRHPVAALGITLSPALLDVNIHPRKTEIKFLHERAIFAGVQEAVEMAVQRLEPAALPWEETVD